MDELRIQFDGNYHTIQIERDYSKLFDDYRGEILMSMDKQYRLDTAARILIGVLKECT